MKKALKLKPVKATDPIHSIGIGMLPLKSISQFGVEKCNYGSPIAYLLQCVLFTNPRITVRTFGVMVSPALGWTISPWCDS